jgi:hypothetical protein
VLIERGAGLFHRILGRFRVCEDLSVFRARKNADEGAQYLYRASVVCKCMGISVQETDFLFTGNGTRTRGTHNTILGLRSQKNP